MRCPTLDELPPPPAGKRGWPWTEASTPLPETMPDGRPWPRMSIVTPSYNQGPFLEETLRSVLLQGYPNLEYIVMDGGSTDASVRILRKYAAWLTYWVSQRDNGQSDAINRGFARASGEIYGWLNSDDIYERDALPIVASYFATTPECGLLYGNGWYVDEHTSKTQPCDWIRPFDRRLYLTTNFILQPAAFWRRAVWERTGHLDVACHWVMDWDWLLRATAWVEPHHLPVDLACFRLTPENKTLSGGDVRRAEIAAISKRHGGFRQPTYVVYQLDRFADSVRGYLGNGPAGRIFEYLMAPLQWILKEKVWRGLYQT